MYNLLIAAGILTGVIIQMTLVWRSIQINRAIRMNRRK